MVCEFCGGAADLLARTQRQAWYACAACHRTWKEHASVAAGPAASSTSPDFPAGARPVSAVRSGLVAVAAVAAAFAVRLALKPAIGDASPFLLFTPAVMVAAFYGGVIPGALAILLSTVLGNHYFLSAMGEPGLERWDRVALFVLAGAMITWVTVASRNARDALSRSLWREQVARAQAEAADHAKDEFLALVSHELQTPASVTLGWAAMLRRGQMSGEAIDKALDAIERNARLESRLVADILDTSRILNGTLRMDQRPDDLAAIVSAAVEQVRPAADARQLHLEVIGIDGSIPILGDAVRLQQVFTNLLANAVKFTPPGGRIEVRVERGATDATVSVSDTGVGIAPEFLPHVFQRFRQEPRSVTHSRAGLGLGLSIARHFVERHGGTIAAASRGAGLGATFTIVLPIDASAASQLGAAEPPEPGSLRSISVLVVEDDEDTRAMVSDVLRRYGARVFPVSTATAAREVVERDEPDVLVCDLRLPDGDGVGLLEELRRSERTGANGLRAASMTASMRPADRERALAAGYAVHLQKPIEPDELAAVVRALGRRPSNGANLVH